MGLSLPSWCLKHTFSSHSVFFYCRKIEKPRITSQIRPWKYMCEKNVIWMIWIYLYELGVHVWFLQAYTVSHKNFVQRSYKFYSRFISEYSRVGESRFHVFNIDICVKGIELLSKHYTNFSAAQNTFRAGAYVWFVNFSLKLLSQIVVCGAHARKTFLIWACVRHSSSHSNF